MGAERDFLMEFVRRFVERRRLRRLIVELDRAAGCDRPRRASLLAPAHRRT
jgi:hypothetical protein